MPKKKNDRRGLSYNKVLNRMENRRRLEQEGVFTRLVSIAPNDSEIHFVDVFVTEISRCFIPKKIIILCPKCDKLAEEKILEPDQAVKLVGRTFNQDGYRFYIRKNFEMEDCPKCHDKTGKLTFRVIESDESLQLEVRDVHQRGMSYEFEIERSETAYYIPKNEDDRRKFLKLVEFGQSIRLQLRQIMKQMANHRADRVFRILDAQISSDIVIDDEIQDPGKLRNLLKQGLEPDSYPENVMKITRSFAQWIGGLDFIKEMIAIWGFTCPDDPGTMFITGDSQVAKSHLFRSFLNWHRKIESEHRDKSYIHDVVLQGENTKRTAFYQHSQVERGGETHWIVKRGVGLKSLGGRLFIDSLCEQNKEIIDVTREAITQHVLTVAGAGTEGLPREFPFVTRLAVTFNTQKETKKVKPIYNVYRFHLLPKVLDYMDLNRFAIKLLIKVGDVPTKTMTTSLTRWEDGMYDDVDKGMIDGKVKFLPPSTFVRLKALCDSLKKKNFEFVKGRVDKDTGEYIPGTMDKLNDLYERKVKIYQGTRVEFYCNALRDQLKSLLRGMAFINYYWKSDDHDGTMKLYVTPQLVDILENKLDEIEKMWGLDQMLVAEEAADEEELVTWELMLTMEDTLKMSIFKLIIGEKHGITLAELSTSVERRKSQVSTAIKWLTDQGLIQPTKKVRGQYMVTRRGALAWRIYCEGPDEKHVVQWFVDMTSAHRDGITTARLYELGALRKISEETIDALLHRFYVEEGKIVEVDNATWKWGG